MNEEPPPRRVFSLFNLLSSRTLKFLIILIILIALPLIIIVSQQQQETRQRASESNTIRITDSNGTTLSTTTSPYVFIELSLPLNWTLPQKPSVSNSLVKNAYAVNIDIDNGGTLPTFTPTPISIPQSSGTCTALGGQCIPLNATCISLGNYVYKDYNNSCTGPSPVCCVPVSSLTSTPTSTPSSNITSTPAAHILQKVVVENIDPYNLGGTAGSSRYEKIIGDGDPLPTHVLWKLREVTENLTARRDVQVTFIDKEGFSVTFGASVILSMPEKPAITSDNSLPPTPTPISSDGSATAPDNSSPSQASSSSSSPSCPLHSKGDADCNGKINMDDRNIWLNEILRQVNNIPFQASSNFNNDAAVDIEDYNIWLISSLDSTLPH